MGVPGRASATALVAAALSVTVGLTLTGCTSSGRGATSPVSHTNYPAPSANAPTAAPVSRPALVWTPRHVPAGLGPAVARLAGVAAVVTVGNGTTWLADRNHGPPGMSVPVDVSTADPRKYAAAVPATPAVMKHLSPGQVVLSTDSARLRRLRVGDVTSPSGVALRVAAIVPDQVIGDAEMFVTAADGRRLGVPAARYVLVRPTTAAAWPTIAAGVRAFVGQHALLRIRAPGTARWLREGDAVLPPLLEKLRFGEFAADPHATAAGYLTIDPRWLSRRLVTAPVPILGRVTCNRAFIPPLRAALRDVVRRHLQGLINPHDYGGCFAPRLIPGQPGQSISHHAYGSALDINVSANEQGQRPRQDRRLVRIFAAHRLTWGGAWLVPDGMHFEFLG